MKYSIINKTELNENFRLDSDFYLPEYIKLKYFLDEKGAIPLCKLKCFITDGEHGSPDWDETTNIKYITAESIKPNYIEDIEFKTISQKQNKLNTRSIIKIDDILIYSVGIFAGYAAMSENHLLPANIPRSVAIIRFLDKSEFLPSYVCVFFNTKYGEFQTKRLQAGNAQPMLALEKIQTLCIPKTNISFQNTIEQIYKKAYFYRQKSKSLYKQSEELLLNELGLLDWQPKHMSFFIKKHSDIEQANRFDAEYYQPKYDEIIDKIKSYKNGYSIIRKEFRQNKTSFIIDNNDTYSYIEIGSISVSNSEITPEIIKGEELPTNAKIKLNKDDILISKVRTYRGAVAIVANDNNIGSGAFTVLQENGKIKKETLLVYFKLKPILDLTLKYNSGTSYPTIFDDDILNIPIPIFAHDIQEEIKTNVALSIKSRETSKQLLEIAKRGVEIAIEENEEIATNWINTELSKIGVVL